MKVLIIAHMRSGSTNLTQSLSKILDVKSFIDPFNRAMYNVGGIFDANRDILPDEGDVINIDCVVKTMPGQIPYTNSTPLEFYKKYYKLFDKTIILKRKNKQDVLESAAAANQTGLWHIEWKYTNDIIITDGLRELVDFENNHIDILSHELQLPITYYEDIYSGDKTTFDKSMNNIGLIDYSNELFKYCNPKKRYRKFENNVTNKLI